MRKIIFALCFLILLMVHLSTRSEVIAWEFKDSKGKLLFVIPETHYATELESNTDRLVAMQQMLRPISVFAFEDYPLELMDLRAPCADESTSVIESLEALPAFARWTESYNLNGALLHAFKVSSSDYGKAIKLILVFSAYSVESGLVGPVDEIYVRGSPVEDLFRRLASDTPSRRLRPLETFQERLEQWCSAAREYRARYLSMEFNAATDWLDASRSKDVAARDKYRSTVLVRVENLLSSMVRCELRSEPCSLLETSSVHWTDAISGLDRSRFDAFIEHRNVNMARRAIELSAEGPVAMLVGAAHVPSFKVDGRIVPGINELLRRAGFRGTPILRCGDQLCPESSVGTPPTAGADSAPPVPTATSGPAPSPGR